MEIHLIAKDELEAQGIRWLVESHFTGVRLVPWNTMEEFGSGIKKQKPELVILDMDGWKDESEQLGKMMQQNRIRWLGISSERIFQTAYRALRFRAEDVLFRPFSPSDLIKHIQQLRYQLRNDRRYFENRATEEGGSLPIDYPDLFLTERKLVSPITMVALLTPHPETLPLVYDALQRYSFTGKHRIFALSDFIVCIRETQGIEVLKEEYHAFLAYWKDLMNEPLTIVIKETSSGDSLKKAYQQIRQLTRLVFFEGYDIVLVENEQMIPQEMDPFLTPLEQRQWIEMLEKRDIKAIRDWVEREFLTFQQPYPDPENVRVRLTSVLAQIRRYMKSHNLQSADWETFYHEVFQQIVHKPVIYQIIQGLLMFITRLLQQNQEQMQEGSRTLVEKAKELIESNYWDAQWNLAACADALRINKSTLSRRFAAESGQSFRKTLHGVRIREAKRLLRETDLSLEEVARLTGYSHQTYFNTKFKQIEACIPSAYRSGL
ncbi:response regulator transcription factor [Priestia filamentosa]|uniref:AraC family transcriptional regulator n=2 Tax=Priestia filamentosa TaxID=1402861 RepID=A0A1X7G0Q1_9BACI|nr:response regulator transcription factor [Priestia filamentosa]AKO92180.1 AraC family transcriptional regulator [Priestia filamentosa]MDT3762202.1 helix-turn-helix domain-containing protein [Priestia filamentosa]OXS65818.1 DNA-binding response regulator [Priestia filamentosa]WRU96694.1 helix-turn-helix domain-containing protein [Priestia filamentosa]SMF61947.1 two component transcriptional regulator, AraC family [Priestia filamentosa]